MDSIHSRISFATAVVVLNAPGLHLRQWSEFEMKTAVALQKRIVVVQPEDNFQQPIPTVLDGNVYRFAPWRSNVVSRAIRGEYPHDNRVFDLAEEADRREIVNILSAGVAIASIAVLVDTARNFQRLHRELAAANVKMRWTDADTANLAEGALVGALLAGALVGVITQDSKAALLAAGAGGLAGAAISVRRMYDARLLGTSSVRILSVAPVLSNAAMSQTKVPKVFISFDYDDLCVKEGLVAQSRDPDCPFKFVDNSIKEVLSEGWILEARRLITVSDCVVVLCGPQSHQSKGQFIELQIAKEVGRRYFLLRASRQLATRPKSASPSEAIHPATWSAVAALLRGEDPARL